MVMAEIGGHYKAHHILNHRKVVRHSLNSNLVQNGPQTLQTTNLNISKYNLKCYNPNLCNLKLLNMF